MAYDRLVLLDDVGRTFTFKAGRVISGGFLVGFSSGTDIVSSGGNFGGYSYSEILVDAGSVGSQNFVGIALQTAAAEKDVAIAMEGIYVLPVGQNAVLGGALVNIDGAGSNFVTFYTGSNAVFRGQPIGRSLSAGTANTGFVLVKFI